MPAENNTPLDETADERDGLLILFIPTPVPINIPKLLVVFWPAPAPKFNSSMAGKSITQYPLSFPVKALVNIPDTPSPMLLPNDIDALLFRSIRLTRGA